MGKQFPSYQHNGREHAACTPAEGRDRLVAQIQVMVGHFAMCAEGNELVQHTANQVREWLPNASETELQAYLTINPYDTGQLTHPSVAIDKPVQPESQTSVA